MKSLTNIFVHVECLDVFEGDGASTMEFDEFFVHSQWGAAY